MNATPIAFRLFAATAAVTVTLGLLATVCSIAEPQRSVLIAQTQQHQQQERQAARAATSTVVATAADRALR